MASCPKCAQQVKDDFGLVTCGHCGASFFLDFEGNVMEDSEKPLQATQFSEEQRDESEAGVDTFEEEMDSFSDSSEELSDSDPELDSLAVNDEGPVEDWGESEPSLEPIENSPGTEWEDDFSAGGEATSEEEPINEESAESVSVEGPFPEPDLPPAPQTTEEAFEEVLSFANSPNMEASEGSLRYNLVIESIDTKDLLKQVFEALEDERFLWDAENLISQTKNGVLRLNDLNPIKASLIVFRLRDVDVEVRWGQENIHG